MLFVRIKGVYYFLLKFCCVEDMDYVFIIVVKDFYDLIYGDIGKLIVIIVFEFFLCEEFFCFLLFICCYEDSNDSLVVKFIVLLLFDIDVYFLLRKL